MANKRGYMGEVLKNQILIWKMTPEHKWFYPIFVLELDAAQQLKQIHIKKNPIFKAFFSLVIFLAVTLLLLFSYQQQPRLIIVASLVMTVFLLLLYLAISYDAYYKNKSLLLTLKNDLEYIESTMNTDYQPNKTISSNIYREKEWTWFKILKRLLFYPICIFLIYISWKFFIPEGKMALGILGIIIALSFIISDLALAFRRKK
ncbi:MAG: hypothetical protein ACK4RM_04130 [Flavobacterium sp.]